MSMNAVTGLLRQHIGLNPESIGHDAISQSIRRRMKAVGVDSAEQYYVNVTVDPIELSALVDDITVGETWFFREFRVFSVLQEKALSYCSARGKKSPFRVASMPCSSGEEAYSIAMSLFDIDLQESQFIVDGYDINRESIGKARKAEYDRLSFRGTMPDFSLPYFSQHGVGFCVKPKLRNCVNFQQVNLLALSSQAELPLYDVIFCRNFLIYLDVPGRQRMSRVLRRCLKDDGILIAGYCEVPGMARLGFHSLDRDRRFAFSKGGRNALTCPALASSTAGAASDKKSMPECSSHRYPAQTDNPAPLRLPSPGKSPQWSAVQAKSIAMAMSRKMDWLVDPAIGQNLSGTPFPPPMDDAAKHCEEQLDAIEVLADNGNLDKARESCRRFLNQHPDNVEVQFMMGVISESAGEWVSAFQHFRKVLYLSPEHHEALLHGAMVCERQGEIAQAEHLRARLSRLIS